MCSNKSYINRTDIKKDHNNKSVPVPFDIENKMVVSDIIDRVECFFYI